MPNYESVATAAREKAKDILRGQMAVRIQERVQNAKDSVVKAIRHYAQILADAAKKSKDAAKAEEERVAKRDTFSQGLGNVPGVSPAELQLAIDAVDEDRKEADNARKEDAKADEKAHAEACDEAAKRIAAAHEELAHATENLEKLGRGELKVNAEELKALAQKLVADSASSPTETV